MRYKYSKFAFFVLMCLFSFLEKSDARDNIGESHINVAMRMVGHEVLLYSGDSSSLVLPVTKDGERYHIRFEKEIQFFPTELMAITNKAIRETGIASGYRVEVEDTNTNEVVYSYEIGSSSAYDMLPCAGRTYPKGNYDIFITILDMGEILDQPTVAALDRLHSSTQEEDTSFSKFGILNISLLLLIGSFIFFWRKKASSQPEIDPDVILLGGYEFNKRSMELSLNNEKTELTAKESDLLILLHSSANMTVEREQLLKKVWGDEGDYVGRTLDVFISKLRKKLEADSTVKIVNIRGVGYKLVLGA